MQQVTQRPDEVTHNIASQNNDKNRSNQFLPRTYKKCERREGVRKKEEAKGYKSFIFVLSTADNYRVPLKNEHPDYINAVFINVMHCHYFLVS